MDGTELPEAVPDDVRDVWIHFGGTHVPEDIEDEKIRAIYERGAGEDPHCMMCGGVLADETIIIVNATGINQIYCTHKCNQDMNVLGWLAQQYDDMKDAVEFRGKEVH